MSFKSLEARLKYAGGSDSISRMNKQKLRSLQSALLNDYNSRLIKTEDGKVCRAIINNKSLKSDYDKESISVEFTSGLKEGDTFEILDNNTHYMIYLPDLVETAYLNAEIIRCRYTLNVNGKDYWVYFQGPVETDITWNIKRNKNFSELNLSGTVYIKNTKETKEHFSRFTKFKFAGHNWEVKATDYISVPGIIELEVGEYFDNIAEDLPVIKKEKTPEESYYYGDVDEQLIVGKMEVDPGEIVGYTIVKELINENYSWHVNHDAEIIETFEDNTVCKVKAPAVGGGVFNVEYGDIILEVFVNPSKPDIIGEDEIYPYSIHDYRVEGFAGKFYIDSPLARIKRTAIDNCTIEVLSGKKGKFTLYFQEDGSDEVFEKPIKILSI